jgi:hypothetical protein
VPGNQGILANADAGREIGTNRTAHTSSGRPAGAWCPGRTDSL